MPRTGSRDCAILLASAVGSDKGVLLVSGPGVAEPIRSSTHSEMYQFTTLCVLFSWRTWHRRADRRRMSSAFPVLPIGAENLPGTITAQGSAVAQQPTQCRVVKPEGTCEWLVDLCLVTGCRRLADVAELL